jgi:tetratricopeptide (TPR) repeat protein
MGSPEPGNAEQTDSEQLAELLEAGIEASRSGKGAEARYALLSALRLDSGVEKAWLWLSSVVQLPEQRRSCLEAVLRINPENAYARAGLEKLGREPGAPGHLAEACPRCSKPLPQAGTRCPSCGLLLVIACPACGELAEAAQVACPFCGNPLGDFHDGAEYYRQLAWEYLRHGREQLGLKAIELAEAAAPGNLAVLRDSAAIREELGNTDSAIAVWRQVIEVDAGNAEAYARLGGIYRRRSMPTEAREMFSLAAARCEDDAETLFQLGQLYYEEWGSLSEARSLLERAVRRSPHHAAAHALLGDICYRQHEVPAAAEHYESALEHAPEGSLLARETQRKLRKVKPTVPDRQAQGWGETLRRMGGLVLVPALAAFLNAGLSPARITWVAWVSLVLATAGAYLWACSTDVPRNPLIRSLFGAKGASEAPQRALLGIPGALMWLGGLAVVLAKL